MLIRRNSENFLLTNLRTLPLIIATTADDTPVMEIDQADMVEEEVIKEEPESTMISAEPGQVWQC